VYTRSIADSSGMYNLLHRPSGQTNGERKIWEPDYPAFAEFVAQLNTEFTGIWMIIALCSELF
jgi:hypothetical protein